MQRWIRDVLKESKDWDVVASFGCREYENRGGFLAPWRGRGEDLWRPAFYVRDLNATENCADLMVQSLVDEDVPLRQPLAFGTYGANFEGGRVPNAILLGMIHHRKAVPKLREALRHDSSLDMRAACAEAMGQMGNAARYYWRDLADIVVDPRFSKGGVDAGYDGVFLRQEATDALRLLGERRAVPYFREGFEAAVSEFEYCSQEDWCVETPDPGLLLEACLKALYEFDPKQAKEVTLREVGSDNSFVRHWVRRSIPNNDISRKPAGRTLLVPYVSGGWGWH